MVSFTRSWKVLVWTAAEKVDGGVFHFTRKQFLRNDVLCSELWEAGTFCFPGCLSVVWNAWSHFINISWAMFSMDLGLCLYHASLYLSTSWVPSLYLSVHSFTKYLCAYEHQVHSWKQTTRHMATSPLYSRGCK